MGKYQMMILLLLQRLYTMFDIQKMSEMDSTKIGFVGENLVASILGGFGCEVSHASGQGYDLVVIKNEEGKVTPIRIDVKTATSASRQRTFHIAKGKSQPGFRDYEAGNCDLFALLCLEDLSLVFKKCSDYHGKRTIYINTSEHINTDCYDSWCEATKDI